MELESYLHFSGNCEEALNFYKSVFGGEIMLNRFEGLHPDVLLERMLTR